MSAIGYGDDAPPIGSPTAQVLDETMDDRLATLQRRMEELERALGNVEPKQETKP